MNTGFRRAPSWFAGQESRNWFWAARGPGDGSNGHPRFNSAGELVENDLQEGNPAFFGRRSAYESTVLAWGHEGLRFWN